MPEEARSVLGANRRKRRSHRFDQGFVGAGLRPTYYLLDLRKCFFHGDDPLPESVLLASKVTLFAEMRSALHNAQAPVRDQATADRVRCSSSPPPRTRSDPIPYSANTALDRPWEFVALRHAHTWV